MPCFSLLRKKFIKKLDRIYVNHILKLQQWKCIDSAEPTNLLFMLPGLLGYAHFFILHENMF